MSKEKPAIAKAKTWIVALTFFALLNSLLFYGFVRGGVWVVLAILSVLLYRKIGHLKFMALTMSFVFATLILLFIAERGLKGKIYYRSHEMLVTTDWDGLKIYQKNADIVFDQKHGDLRNMAPDSTELVNAPRTVKYRVDSFGYRNDADYAGQPYVLVGDSFVVGSGTSQEHILSTQLKETHDIDAYNLAHPGDTGDYLQYMKKFNAEYGTTHKALVFLFEGNDFVKVSRPKTVAWLGRLNGPYLGVRNLFRKYRSFFHDTQLYRYTFIVYKALTSGPGGDYVKIKKIGDRNIGLYTGYVAASEQVECKLADDMTEAFGEVKENTHAFVFVPTKYRVYADLWDEPAKDLPNANLDCAIEVGKRLGIPVINLTPAMQKAAKQELETNNELIFWPDDTHWNPRGIAVGAKAVKEALEKMATKPTTSLLGKGGLLVLPGNVRLVTPHSDDYFLNKTKEEESSSVSGN